MNAPSPSDEQARLDEHVYPHSSLSRLKKRSSTLCTASSAHATNGRHQPSACFSLSCLSLAEHVGMSATANRVCFRLWSVVLSDGLYPGVDCLMNSASLHIHLLLVAIFL